MLSDAVGWLGIGQSVFMILDGTYELPSGLDEYTRKLIAHLWKNNKAKRESPELKITPEEWKNFWKGAKERPSCASEILHFGTWKVGAHRDIIPEAEGLLTNNCRS
jgi:hypothetical protein